MKKTEIHTALEILGRLIVSAFALETAHPFGTPFKFPGEDIIFLFIFLALCVWILEPWMKQEWCE